MVQMFPLCDLGLDLLLGLFGFLGLLFLDGLFLLGSLFHLFGLALLLLLLLFGFLLLLFRLFGSHFGGLLGRLLLLGLFRLLLVRGARGEFREVAGAHHPITRSELVGLTMLVESTGKDHLLLGLGARTETPLHVVGVTLHDNALDDSAGAVIDGGHDLSGHLGNTGGDGFTLGGHHDDVRANLDVVFETKDTGDHELGTVGDSVDGGVLDDDSLVAGKDALERHDDSAEVRLIASRFVQMHGIEDVVHGDETVLRVFGENTGTDTTQLLHVCADTEDETQMHTERTDVGTGLARAGEGREGLLLIVVKQSVLVDRTDTQLTLDGRNDGRALEQSTLQVLEGRDDLGLASGLVVETNHSHVLLTSGLLGLDQTGGAVDADQQTAGDLGIEGTRVTSLLTLEDLLHPGHNLMGRRVDRLVQIDDAVQQMLLQSTSQGTATMGQRHVVTRADVQLVVILQQQRPFAGVDGLLVLGGLNLLRFNGAHLGIENNILRLLHD